MGKGAEEPLTLRLAVCSLALRSDQCGAHQYTNGIGQLEAQMVRCLKLRHASHRLYPHGVSLLLLPP
jgi:hypothetical protein